MQGPGEVRIAACIVPSSNFEFDFGTALAGVIAGYDIVRLPQLFKRKRSMQQSVFALQSAGYTEIESKTLDPRPANAGHETALPRHEHCSATPLSAMALIVQARTQPTSRGFSDGKAKGLGR